MILVEDSFPIINNYPSDGTVSCIQTNDSANNSVATYSIKSVIVSLCSVYDQDESGSHFETEDKLIEDACTQLETHTLG